MDVNVVEVWVEKLEKSRVMMTVELMAALMDIDSVDKKEKLVVVLMVS
jgi:hypothetical protein